MTESGSSLVQVASSFDSPQAKLVTEQKSINSIYISSWSKLNWCSSCLRHFAVRYALFYFLNSNVVQQMRSYISKYHMCTTHITDLSQWKCLAKAGIFYVCFIYSANHWITFGFTYSCCTHDTLMVPYSFLVFSIASFWSAIGSRRDSMIVLLAGR